MKRLTGLRPDRRGAVEYDTGFYEGLAIGARRSADVVVPTVLELGPIRSVLDVGCGVGAWLAAFRDLGVDDLTGLERPGIPRDVLAVDPGLVHETDLARGFDLGRRFDLVISLEVGEHLPPGSGPGLVRSIAAHTDLVVFSAAIPGQGGVGHFNEQWPTYWVRLFERHGFEVLDLVRRRLWEDPSVEAWYVQNTLVYARGAALDEIRARNLAERGPLDLVHPRLWSRGGTELGVRELSRRFPPALANAMRLRAVRLLGRERRSRRVT